MKKPTILIAAIGVFLSAVAIERNAAQQDFRSFQLVYHSDTRGYLRPCG